MSWAPGLLAALSGGLLLGFATPPAVAPFAEWLVVPALTVWFAIATCGRRPLLHSYVLGCVHMAWFSWSVRHVLLPAYIGIVAVGGLYYLLATAAVRGLPARLRWVGFAVAVAGTFWLRAVMPEIHYPHGQPCHALYEWPLVCRAAVLGGEPLLNALLALVASSAWELGLSWRVAAPCWRRAARGSLVTAALCLGCVVAGNVISSGARASAAAASGGEAVRVVAIEPGFHPFEVFSQPPAERRAWDERMLRERLLQPTKAALARGEDDVDLVVWPESILRDTLEIARIERGVARLLPHRLPASAARLVVGANVRRDGRLTPAAMALELPSGRVLGHQEKRWLVPGGEFLPFLSLLPESWSASVREQFRRAMGSLPDCARGVERPPMRTARGVRFGALVCYDNGYPGPAAEQVERGAELLVVLSNEAWYRGGGELSQLVASSVMRACENVLPIVRCTQDGRSVAIDAGGAIVDQLPLAPAPQPGPRTLAVSLQRGAGKPPAFTWLRRSTGWISGLVVGLGALASLWRWGRARRWAKGSVGGSLGAQG